MKDLSVRLLHSTDVFCGKESLEALYLEGLGAANEFEVEGDRLRLRHGDQAVLEFVRK